MAHDTNRGPRRPLAPLLRLLALVLSALLLAAAGAAAHAGRRPSRVLPAPAFLHPCRLCLGSQPTPPFAGSIAIAGGRQRARPVAAIWASARGGEGGGNGDDDAAPLRPLAVKAGEQAGWAELLWLVARLEDRVYEQAAAARALERRLEEVEDRLGELEDGQFPRNMAPDTEAAERKALEWRLGTVERRIDTLDAGAGGFVSKWEVDMEATARKDLARRLEALESMIKESSGALGAQGEPEASVGGKIWDGAVSILGPFWDFLWPILFALGFVFIVVYDAWELYQIFDQVQDALPPKG